MGNTKKVKMNPVMRSANQTYVPKYNALAEISKQINDTGQKLIGVYAKTQEYNNKQTTNRASAEFDAELTDFKRNIALTEDYETWSEKFNDKVNELRDKYKDIVPSGHSEDFNNHIDLSIKQADLDLKYLQNKKSLDNANKEQDMFLDTTAKLTVGKTAAEVKLYDAQVIENITSAVNAGRLSRVDGAAKLKKYDDAKKNGNMEHLILTAPEQANEILKTNAWGFDQTKLDYYRTRQQDELKNRQIKSDIMVKATQNADVQVALDCLSKGIEIPMDTMQRLKPSVQRQITIRQQYALMGEDVPTNENTYDYLRVMARNNPEKFAELDLYEYMGELNINDLNTFKYMQNGISVDQKTGKAKLSADVQFDSDLKAMAYERLGYKNKTKGDKEKMYNFNLLYEQEARAAIAEKGRALTSLEKKDIVDRLTKEVSINRNWGVDRDFKYAETTEDDFNEGLEETNYFEDGDGALKPNDYEQEIIFDELLKHNITMDDFSDEEIDMWSSRLVAAQRSPVGVRKDRVQRVIASLDKYTKNRGSHAK